MDRLDDCHDLIRMLIVQLNHSEQWMLSTPQIDEYTDAITQLYSDSYKDHNRLNQVITDYHSVQVLLNPAHREHQHLWHETIQYIIKLLGAKNFASQHDRKTVIADLVQEICLLIFKSMNHFKYKSRLRTWIFTIVNNQYLQYWRKVNKLNQPTAEHSLDDMNSLDITDHGEALEALVGFGLLYEHCLAVLKQADDPRFVTIFQHYAVERQTLEKTAQKLGLGIARIHELYRKIQVILQNDPVIQHWRDDLGLNGKG